MKKLMMKKLMLIICIVCFVLAGCARTAAKQESLTTIKFKDMMDISELQKLDGQQVKITGFMAQSSPLDGSMIYLMNLPYQNCVYCVPNSKQLVNTMATYPKKGENFEFTELPVDIVGTLEFGEMTDEMGYFYAYRIVDAEAIMANMEEVSDSVKAYTQLVDKGFVTKVSGVLNLVDQALYNLEFGIETKPISEALVNEIYKIFDEVDKSLYTDLIDVVTKLDMLVQGINYALEVGDVSQLDTFTEKNYEIFYSVYEWLMQAEL